MAFERRTIGELCLGLFDGPHATPPESATGPVFLRIDNIERSGRLNLSDIRRINYADFPKWTRRVTPQEDDIVFSYEANLGLFCRVPKGFHGCLGRRLALVRPNKEKVDPAFLLYACLAPQFQELLRQRTVLGSTVDRISLREFPTYALQVPPLSEQKAIASILGALDDKIELNRRMNATLEAMARALFQSWFVDFDPVRAKLDGRQPVGMDAETAALFPAHFAHDEHGVLPVGWRRTRIEEICKVNASTLSKTDDLETLEYIEISEVSRGNIANIATYTRGEEPSRARRRLSHGDTVLSTVRPDRGSYFLALNPPEKRVASTGFAVLTPHNAPWSYIHACMTQPEVFEHLGQMADGGAYPAVRPEIIGAMNVTVPSEPRVLEAFDRVCAPLYEQAESNRIQSRTLAALRDTLLPKLLSGELRVASR